MTPSTIGEKELLPCPLCGEHLIRTESSAQAGIREPFYEHPDDGDCVLRVMTFLSRPAQIAAWNRRKDGLGTVSVKPLEWVETTSPREDGPAEPIGEWTATSAVGVYTVYSDSDEEMFETPWVAWGEFNSLGHFESPESARAAAQSDFETRVKSCLTSIGVEAGK